jgi:hypothetical protein
MRLHPAWIVERQQRLLQLIPQILQPTSTNRLQTANYIHDRSVHGELVSIKYINTFSKIYIYKLVYISVKDNYFEEQSATLYIPVSDKIKTDKIIIWVHGTFVNVGYNVNDIGWLYYDTTVEHEEDLLSFSLAKQNNCIVIAPDNASYGSSAGIPHYLDTLSQTYSVVDSVIAFRNLCLRPEYSKLIITDSMSSMSIYLTGYSLGGIFLPGIANEIISYSNKCNTFKISLKKIICGGPVNGPAFLNSLTDLSLTTLSADFLFFILLYICSKEDLARIVLKIDIYKELLPMFNDLYSNTPLFYSKLNNKIQSLILNGVIKVNNQRQILANSILIIENAKFIREKEIHNLTNPFLDFPNISNIPLYIIYSSNDELCNLKNDSGVITDSMALFDTDNNGTFPSDTIKAKIFKQQDKFFKYELIEQELDSITTSSFTFLNDIKNTDAEKYIRIKVISNSGHVAFHERFISIVTVIVK